MGEKYDSAWLTYNDDLTGRERYVLHVKAEGRLANRFTEMNAIYEKLRQKLDPESLRFVSRVDVHNHDEPAQGWNEDVIVLEKDGVV